MEGRLQKGGLVLLVRTYLLIYTDHNKKGVGGTLKKIFVMFYFIAMFSLFWGPTDVSAHAYLASSTPQQESGMNQPLQEIRLQFTEKINADISKVIVKDSSGKIVNGKQSSENAEWLIVTVDSLPKDVYTVEWQVLSVDSHVTEGAFRFAVGKELEKIRPAETVSLDEVTATTPVPAQPAQPVPSSNYITKPATVANATKPTNPANPVNPINAIKPTTKEPSEAPSNQSGTIPVTQQPVPTQQTTTTTTGVATVTPETTSTPATTAIVQTSTTTNTETRPSTNTSIPASHDHGGTHSHDHHQTNHQEHQHSHLSGWLRVVQILLAMGVGAFIFLRVWPGFMTALQEMNQSIEQLERNVLWTAIILFFVLDVSQIVVLATQLLSFTNNLWTTMLSIITSSFVGAALLIRLVVMSVLIWLAYQPQSQPSHYWLRGILFIGLMVPFYLTGHQMTVELFWGVPLLAHMIHCGAAAVWTGGIFGLVFVSFSQNTRNSQLPTLAKQFAKAALMTVVLLSVTGFVLSTFKLDSFGELLSTSYGNVLLWKMTVFAIALIIAGILRFFVLPSVTTKLRSTVVENSPVALIWCLRSELATVIGIVIVAGLLATTAPPM